MQTFWKNVVSCAVVAALSCTGTAAQAATPKQVDKNATTQDVAQTDSTTLRAQDISEGGYVLSIEKGVAEKKADGTVIVHDQDGKVAATLQKSFLVSDGSVNHVDYDVNGDTVVAKYSSPLVKGKKTPVVNQDVGDCIFGSMGATGAALAMGGIILSGGTGLAVAGAVVTAGAASGHAGYTCGKAAKGR